MGDFKFWPVVLAGPDLIRRHPLRMVGLMLVGLVVSVGFRLCGVLLLHLQIYSPSSAPSFSMPLTLLLASGLLVLVVAAVIGASVMRTVATDDPRARRIDFGGDETRLLVLSLLLAPAALIVFAALAAGAALSVALHVGDAPEDRVMTSAVALGVILVLFLASRLSLAGPAAVRDGRMRLGESWRLTRAKRWKVFGVFLVATVLAAAIAALGTVGVATAVRTLNLSASQTVSPYLLKSILGAFQAVSLPPLVASGALIGLALILQAAPAAALHRALVGDRARDQAAAFD